MDQRGLRSVSYYAQAESLIGLHKLECVPRDDPWRGVDEPELPTLRAVHWFNHQRRHPKIGHPARTEQCEDEYFRQKPTPQQPLPGEPALH